VRRGIGGVLKCGHDAKSSARPVVGNLLSLHDVKGVDDNAGRKPKSETVRTRSAQWKSLKPDR
jgi:hypothetical protein